MRKRVFILLIIPLIVFAFGCADVRKLSIELSESDIKNAESTVEVAKNLLTSWPVWSGVLKGALGPRINELPVNALKAWAELDDLSCKFEPSSYPPTTCEKAELSKYELGYSVGVRILMLYEVVFEALKEIAPDVLELVPMVI